MHRASSLPLLRSLLLSWVATLCACGGDVPGAGFAELLARDPLRSSYDFERAAHGDELEDGQVVNGGAHIEYGNYFVGELTAGIQGGEKAVLMDLGTEDELAARLEATQTVGGGQGFARLQLVDGRFSLPEANAALEAEPSSTAHLTPSLEHVYLLRITRDPDEADLLVKLLVVSLQEKEAISFEWVRLDEGA